MENLTTKEYLPVSYWIFKTLILSLSYNNQKQQLKTSYMTQPEKTLEEILKILVEAEKSEKSKIAAVTSVAIHYENGVTIFF